MADLTRDNYRKLDTRQLQRRYSQLEADISAQTVEEECGRMFALQEIGAVLGERGLPSDQWAPDVKRYASEYSEHY